MNTANPLNQQGGPLNRAFFHQDPRRLAISLLGKVLRRRYKHPQYGQLWLSARIIETEAYYLDEKGSHSSLGLTPSRQAMFMPPGTIYMYYARGADSLNFSALGDGNAVLIKSALPYLDHLSTDRSLSVMQDLNPLKGRPREPRRLCAGQTLLCRALNLKVPEWNLRQLDPARFYLEDTGYLPEAFIQCPRMGIPTGRDEHLPYRFVDLAEADACTSNPVRKRSWSAGRDYRIVPLPQSLPALPC